MFLMSKLNACYRSVMNRSASLNLAALMSLINYFVARKAVIRDEPVAS